MIPLLMALALSGTPNYDLMGPSYRLLEDAPTAEIAVWRFTAGWCPACRAMDGVVARVRARGIRIYDADADDQRNWRAIGATPQPIPYFALWVGTEVRDRRQGSLSEEEFLRWVGETADDGGGTP